MNPVDPGAQAQDLPRTYAAWRCRTLAGAIIATAMALVAHGPMGELHLDLSGEWPSIWQLLSLVVVVIAAFVPPLLGSCFALAALWSWRRLRTSRRLVWATWILWVLGPLPVLLLPVTRIFDLNLEDSLRTSAAQVRYILLVTAPAFFALLPGTLRAALMLERFLPESRASGQIVLLAAPACTFAYLLPVALLTQLAFPWGAFQWGPYLGLLLLASSHLVPLLAVRGLLRRNTPGRAARLVRTIVLIQGFLGVLGVALIALWVEDHPLLREWLGKISAVWVIGLAAKVLANKWLTEVVVTDQLLSMLHQNWESTLSLAQTPEGQALAQKLDALGHSLRPATPPDAPPGPPVSAERPPSPGPTDASGAPTGA